MQVRQATYVLSRWVSSLESNDTYYFIEGKFSFQLPLWERIQKLTIDKYFFSLALGCGKQKTSTQFKNRIIKK